MTIIDHSEDDEWQTMPIITSDLAHSHAHYDFDNEDIQKFRPQLPTAPSFEPDEPNLASAPSHMDNDETYTRLNLAEDEEEDRLMFETRALFNSEDHEQDSITAVNQQNTTKSLLSPAARIAYVALVYLVTLDMVKKQHRYHTLSPKEVDSAQLWQDQTMRALFLHIEVTEQEQKMIASLAAHSLGPADFVHSLVGAMGKPKTMQVEVGEKAVVMEGDDGGEKVQKAQSDDNKEVEIDLRYTVLCDLFLILISSSVYDARSRVLLLTIGNKLGLTEENVIRFERRITEALEINEGGTAIDSKAAEVVKDREHSDKSRRYVLMGLATIGGGLVIGLSAGLLAPVIGAGLGAAFTTIGVSGTSTFLAGLGGSALITTGGVITGSTIATKGMAKRTMAVQHFQFLPLHNNKRVSCLITVSGFMNGVEDDVRLPFSVLSPVIGDVFSLLWEPQMMSEMGNALRILANEVLTTVGQQMLQATVLAALMSALQWPLLLTKLGYLIDNPWSNALDRCKQVGLVLADTLIKKHMGVRPVSLVGFSLGARVIFYALKELARVKAYGIVENVFLCGTAVTASTAVWQDCRSVVAGRFVNVYARNDWLLGYLFRATNGGLGTVAGLRPVPDVIGLENLDVTDIIVGHMSYRQLMPLILQELGFMVTATEFDDPNVEYEDQSAETEADPEKAAKFAEASQKLEDASKTNATSRFSKFFSFKKKPAAPDSLPDMKNFAQDSNIAEDKCKTLACTPAPNPMEMKTDDSQSGMGATVSAQSAGFDLGKIRAVLETQADSISVSVPSPEINSESKPAFGPKTVASPIIRTSSSASQRISVPPNSAKLGGRAPPIRSNTTPEPTRPQSQNSWNPSSPPSYLPSLATRSSPAPPPQPPIPQKPARFVASWEIPAQPPGPSTLCFGDADGFITSSLPLDK